MSVTLVNAMMADTETHSCRVSASSLSPLLRWDICYKHMYDVLAEKGTRSMLQMQTHRQRGAMKEFGMGIDEKQIREEGKEKASHVCQMVDRSLWFFDKTRPCKLRRSANIRHPES